MAPLTDCLERFNRKERNLLIRDALALSPGKPPSLSVGFRERIGEALDCRVPDNAWWATDYHLNWIAGALTLLRMGENAINGAQANLLAENGTRYLIERNQEDADLLIAFDTTLILIEVKAFGWFSNKQIDSKVCRWLLLKQLGEQSHVAFHFMLMSRTKPTGLKEPPKTLLPGRTEWPHAELKLPTERLKVTGKSSARTGPADPRSWFIERVSLGSDGGDEDSL